MKTSPFRFVSTAALITLASMSVANSAAAQQAEQLPARRDEPIIIRRTVKVNESLPELGARLYEQVDYELRLSRLNNEIKLATAELSALREQLAFYHRDFKNTPALRVTRRNAELAVLESELHLKQLKYERMLLRRHRADQIRIRKLLLAAGQAELELVE